MIHFLDNTNLLDWFDAQTVPTGITHQCNCFHTMGGGIAAQIAKRYPEAYEADTKTKYGDASKLGSFSSTSLLTDSKKTIYNLYGQFTFGVGKQTSYDALDTGLDHIRIRSIAMGLTKLGIPFNMGCTLGGGNWNVVGMMIMTKFPDDDDIDLYICKYNP